MINTVLAIVLAASTLTAPAPTGYGEILRGISSGDYAVEVPAIEADIDLSASVEDYFNVAEHATVDDVILNELMNGYISTGYHLCYSVMPADGHDGYRLCYNDYGIGDHWVYWHDDTYLGYNLITVHCGPPRRGGPDGAEEINTICAEVVYNPDNGDIRFMLGGEDDHTINYYESRWVK